MPDDERLREDLVAYLRGRLNEAEVAVFETRLASDESLRAELERTRTVLDIVDAASEETTVRWVNELLEKAFTARASDIHLDLNPTEVIVRLRIDGVLHVVEQLPFDQGRACVGRLKQLCDMPPADFVQPADGRFRTEVNGKRLDLRGSYVPGLAGGRLCLRLLDASAVLFEWDRLGLLPKENDAVQKLIHAPCGLVTVCGPTGSGKSTLLYQMIKAVARPEVNVLSVEDPVEIDLPWVAQTQTKPQLGLGFAPLLRSLMRQDPDVIMVGEIRDRETLEMCCQAALTGHLVLTTLHTNSAAAAVARMLDIGLPAFVLGQSLIGSIGMRLVRKICPDCRIEVTDPGNAAARQLGLQPGSVTLSRGQGCETCRGTGYRGRTGLYEVLAVTRQVAEAIAAGSPTEVLHSLAFAGELPDLRGHGARLVAEGVTTAEEVVRVLQQTW